VVPPGLAVGSSRNWSGLCVPHPERGASPGFRRCRLV